MTIADKHQVIDIKADVSKSVKITTVSHYENEGDDTSTFIDNRQSCWLNIMGNIYADDDPHLYSNTKKNIIVFIIALSGISSTIGNMIYMPDVVRISQDLNTTLTGMTGTVAVYVVFIGIAVSVCTVYLFPRNLTFFFCSRYFGQA